MSNEETLVAANFIELTAEIVAVYVANNSVQASGMPELIATVHSAVAGLSKPAAALPDASVPAVNPKKSIFPGYIICLDDGKRFKSMKRHLALLGNDTRRVPRQMGLGGRLSDGRTELRRRPLGTGQEKRSRP